MTIDIQAAMLAAKQEIAMLDDVVRSDMVGSAMFSPNAKDVDFVVLVKRPALDYVGDLLGGERWEFCGDYDSSAEGAWGSVRCGLVNLIITSDADRYDRFVQAAEVCAALKLTSKHDRILVHRIVRDQMNRADAALAAFAFADTKEDSA